MPTTSATTRLALAAAAGLLLLTACSGADTATPTPSSSATSDAASPAALSSQADPTSTKDPGTDLSEAPLGTVDHSVQSLTVAGEAVKVPDGTTIALSPDQPAFQAAVSGICGQPRWGVSVQKADLWSASDDVPQPAEGCTPEAPGQAAKAALARLFTGEVQVRPGDDDTLTLTRGDVELVLAPRG